MIDIKHNRRFFLKSAAGFCLTLPTLPSLLSKAHAQALTVTPRFVSMNLDNGGLLPSNWYPSNTNFGAEQDLYPGENHTIRESDILLTNGGISPVFDSKFAKYTSDMNIYRGLDGMFDWVHHSGWLGNFRDCNVHDLTPALKAFPSIDNVIGYTRDNHLAKRAMIFTQGKWRNEHFSHSWEGDLKNPSSVERSDAQKLDALFNTLFTGSGTTPQLDTEKILAVDKVLESFNGVMDTTRFGVAKRISQEDRNRLAEHMEKIRDIETRLNDIPNACSNDITIDNFDTVNRRFISGVRPKSIAETKVNYQVFTDLITEAFHCDVNRVASILSSVGGTFFSPTTYHDYTHGAHRKVEDQKIGVDYKKFVIDELLFPLLEKLSARMDSNGNSILDNSLVCLFDESSVKSHTNTSMPVVTFGSANGYFNTGKYVDYRHLSNYREESFGTLDGNYDVRHGIPWNRFLATILQSMNVGPSVWERPGQTGYGETYISGDSRSGLGSYSPEDFRSGYQYQMNDLSQSLPLVTA